MSAVAQGTGRRLRLPALRPPKLTTPAWLRTAVEWSRPQLERLTRLWAVVRRPFSVVTPVGWLASLGGLVLFVAGLRFGWVEAIATGVVGLVTMGIAVVWTLGRSNYEAAIELESLRVRVGEQVLGRVTLTNRGRRGLAGTLIELPVGRGAATFTVPPMDAGSSHEEIFTVPTRRRAVIQLGPVRSVQADPLGLIRRVQPWSESLELFVHPRTVLVSVDTAGLLKDIEGITTQDLSSSDVAFHALRDYVPGDDRRSVHWRSTARTGRLIVRQFEETRRTHLLVVLNLDQTCYATPDEFETAVSTAGSLVLQAAREEREVSLYTQDGLVSRRSPMLLLDELSRYELRNGVIDLVGLVSAATTEVPDCTVLAVVTGARTTPAQMLRVHTFKPADATDFVVLCDESRPAALHHIATMAVLGIATLDELPGATRSLR